MAKHLRPHLSHVGIFVRELGVLERFYTSVFGLIVTDRGVGKTFRNELVFLSGNPEQHHQLVLSTGRASDAPSTVMQLSFMVDSLDELRALHASALEHGATGMIGLNHGNSWSIYFDDPEGNKIEIYVDTPFHTPQPCGEPLNLEQSDEQLLAETEALISSRSGSMERGSYVAKTAERLASANGPKSPGSNA